MNIFQNFMKIFIILLIFSLYLNLSGCLKGQADIKALKKQKIAFISDRDGNPDIYVMDGNGKNPIRITRSKASEFKPAWSPDGTLIIFASDRSGPLNTDIFTVRYSPEGGERNLKKLTDYMGTDKDPVYSSSGDKIAYVSGQENSPSEQIMLMNPDGKDKIAITRATTWSENVQVPWEPLPLPWATDQKELKTYQLGAWIYTHCPTWSPDGRRIAFECFGMERTHKIYFIDPNQPASRENRIKYIKLETTDEKGNPKGDQIWSTKPEGHWILGVFDRSGKLLNPIDESHTLKIRDEIRLELYAANSGFFKEGQTFKLTINYTDDTSEEILTKITSQKKESSKQIGTKIFWKGIDSDAVSSGEKPLPDKLPDGHFSLIIQLGAIPMKYNVKGFADRYPAWSPKGDKIAFTSDRDGNEEIYISNPDGSKAFRLTNNPARDYAPAWSPDGKKIAFTSNRDGLFNEEIYVINIDGTNLINLSLNPHNDSFPAWSPLSPSTK